MLSAPVPSAHSKGYCGVFDIRLVRMSREPFTLREMRVAGQHNGLLEAFWREGAQLAYEGVAPSPTVTGFTSEYWMGKSWGGSAEANSLSSNRAHVAASPAHGAS